MARFDEQYNRLIIIFCRPSSKLNYAHSYSISFLFYFWMVKPDLFFGWQFLRNKCSQKGVLLTKRGKKDLL